MSIVRIRKSHTHLHVSFSSMLLPFIVFVRIHGKMRTLPLSDLNSYKQKKKSIKLVHNCDGPVNVPFVSMAFKVFHNRKAICVNESSM